LEQVEKAAEKRPPIASRNTQALAGERKHDRPIH
jgi:hypothetical protein